MTDLRQAAEAALDALNLPSMKTQQMLRQRDEAIATLRAALAEEALQRLTNVQQEIEAVLEQPQQQAEPLTEGEINGLRELSPLEEICITGRHDGWVIEFARAIEQAHGIGEKP